ncbi:metallophosphoesterase family protein [Leifsonia sp. McL0607]|uniref:metallophosphoesterase family protein n=1 Tax=Leifsonia sp. McL0607 TaxID=3415672 RepID=UPI003CFBAE3B
MRIAAISDVHGNVFALPSVLEALRTMQVDVLTNLGDHLSGGVDPAATADLLLATSAVSVRGNHERQLLEYPRHRMGASDGLAADTISNEHRRWLRALPVRAEAAPGVLAFHGGPEDDLVYLLETVTPEGVRPATEAEVVERLGETEIDGYSLLLSGHTHLQRQLRLRSGALVVNPGSVGMPAYREDGPTPHVIEAGSPHARFAVLDDAAGRWDATFHAIEYPWDEAAEAAQANGRHDVVHALLTGRVK